MMHECLAKHILLNLRGMALVQCIDDLSRTDKVTLDTLGPAMRERGIYYPPGGKHPSIMRLWLSKAGVFPENGWEINNAKLRQILGVDVEAYNDMMDLTIEQRSFLRALVNTGVTDPQPANNITKLATATYGVRFPEKSLPKMVLNTLTERGYITAEKTTQGRGAKPFLVAPTEKVSSEIIEPLFDQLKDMVDPKLMRLLRLPLEDILKDLRSSDRYVAGLALEALAFKLMRLIDMKYQFTRLRAEATGGAEVDLVFESIRLVYSRWQIQCKNTARVSLDDIAKEVGLTYMLKSNAILIVTTGKIGGEARRYANKIMSDLNICIIMVDGDDLEKIVDNPSNIVEVFNREAEHAMKLKRLDGGTEE